MKVFIAVDLEGICGSSHEWDTDPRGARLRPRARRRCGPTSTPALDGCRAAGADEIVVCDAHNDGGNLDPDGAARRRHARGRLADAGQHAAGHRARLRRRPLRRLPRARGDAGRRARAHLDVQGVRRLGRRRRARRVRPRRAARRATSACRPCTSPATTRSRPRRGRSCRASRRRWSSAAIMRTSAALVPPDEARARIRADVAAALEARAEAAPLEWSGDPLRADVHAGAVLRRGVGVSGGAAPRRAHAADRRRGLRRRSIAAFSPASTWRYSASALLEAAGRRLEGARRGSWSNGRASGCSVAGNTSASQAEDRGFESRHPLQSPSPPDGHALRPPPAPRARGTPDLDFTSG